MQSITSDQSPYGDATVSPRQPPHAPSTSATTQPAPKRRHRVDSNPLAQWSTSDPDAKRARASPNYSDTNHNTMSAKLQGKHPQQQSSSTSSNYKPHHIGARKLVIKNLQTKTPARVASINEYLAARRLELDEALDDLFAGRPAKRSMDMLYRGVEDLCRHDEAKKLFQNLQKKCEGYLAGDEVLGRIQTEAKKGDDVGLLRAVLGFWTEWSAKLLAIRWIFSYLDRSYLLPVKGQQMINDTGIYLFRKAIFGHSAAFRRELSGLGGEGGGEPSLGRRVLAAICRLVDFDRRGDERFEPGMLKEAVGMLKLFQVYGKFFERLFLDESHQYFLEFAEERSVSYGLRDYIIACERLLEREDQRCDGYHFDSTTKRQLRDDAHHILVEKYSNKLLEGGSVAKLLGGNDTESMAALYRLLKLSGIQKRLKGPWDRYIREAGALIVSDITRGDDMVIRLLELRRGLDIMIRDAFEQDEDFTYGLREAFAFFINDRTVLSKWNTGTSKVGEMIAKYVDMLLRGGLKAIPKSLLSDERDRADAENSGLASTGDEDAELDRQLDHALELFRFIDGKDVFEAFYKRDLARRLLMSRSASQDAERNMISKLKSECGSSFTHNLEQMFKDQELAKDEMSSYKEWLKGTSRTKNRVDLDLSVNILSAAAWPSYPEARVLLPKDVLDQIITFDNYYKSKHTGRRLTWMHNLAYCVVRAQFDRGPKELMISAFQAVVLVLFNQVENKADGVLSYEQISQSTGLTSGDLDRTLQSLACGKVRVLTKHPKGRDIKPTDTFTVNKGFTDPKYRVKINQIQLKETKEENKETHERVAADRQFETQAAIVRIMKSRKTMNHVQLVSEVLIRPRAAVLWTRRISR